MAAVNELRNARPRPVSLNRSVYQLVRTPIDDDPEHDTHRDRPNGAANLMPEKRPINQATATMTRKMRIAFQVLWTLNSAPHHLVE